MNPYQSPQTPPEQQPPSYEWLVLIVLGFFGGGMALGFFLALLQ